MRRTLSTCAVGALAVLLSRVTHQSPSTVLTVAVAAAGMTLIIEFLVTFERRLSGVETELALHSDEMTTLLGTSFAQISEATKLFARVDGSRLRTDAVTQLVRNATEIGADGPEIVHVFTQKEFERLSALLKGLKGGEATYDGEDHDWLLALCASATATIDATSTAVDVGFWRTELGLRYLAAQRAAIDRGVRVRRLFILESPEPAAMEELHRVCQQQTELGVTVKLVTINELPPRLKLDPMFDFIVFDQSLSYEVTPGLPVEHASHPVIANTRLVLRTDRVSYLVKRFNELWNASESLE
ncbi:MULTISPECIES: DUF6879 family protein [unclassified Kitasatospora]|uniref:DUF6879 family protein n=1 Tax=unclassified Kitasatospora TaxID=2633591 RepID=UPI002473CFCE|nr:hypothetical protein [Kitasatospora sp. MAP12-44]